MSQHIQVSGADCSDNQTAVGACPQCGHSTSKSPSFEWADIARVSNLAEAGFLSDELNGVGIEASVQQLDDFSAASDSWSSKYLIRVPVQFTREAAAHIEPYLFEEDHGHRPVLDVLRNPLRSAATDRISWRPVVLAIIASVASFTLGQRFSAQVPPRRPSAGTLPSAVAAINKRFTTDSIANQPRHRLSFDQRLQQWTLETDHDNDGAYDQARHFPAASIR